MNTLTVNAGAQPRPGSLQRGAAAVEAILGWGIERLAAALIVVEIAILLAGVVSRYVLGTPLVWTDELASILFLWLSMLGAVFSPKESAAPNLVGRRDVRPGDVARLRALLRKAERDIRGDK